MPDAPIEYAARLDQRPIANGEFFWKMAGLKDPTATIASPSDSSFKESNILPILQ